MLDLGIEAGREGNRVSLEHTPEEPQSIQARHDLVVPVIPQRLRPGERQPDAERRQGQHRPGVLEAGRLEARVRRGEGDGDPRRGRPGVGRGTPVEEPVVERQNAPRSQGKRADVLEVLGPPEDVADLGASSVAPSIPWIAPAGNDGEAGALRGGVRHGNPQSDVPRAPVLAEAVDRRLVGASVAVRRPSCRCDDAGALHLVFASARAGSSAHTEG
mmetsp:Transcript_41310/g.128390  ORF Transcript_41310/g.128390 Transcript_41310/m.128390 type:complete len:216 (-) Transcript_41310:1118-1765(-)